MALKILNKTNPPITAIKKNFNSPNQHCSKNREDLP